MGFADDSVTINCNCGSFMFISKMKPFLLRAEGLVNFVWGNNINKIGKEWLHEESENFNLVKREHVAAEKQSG